MDGGGSLARRCPYTIVSVRQELSGGLLMSGSLLPVPASRCARYMACAPNQRSNSVLPNILKINHLLEQPEEESTDLGIPHQIGRAHV